VQISHPVSGDAMTGLQGVFSQPYSPGTYGLVAVLYIPHDCGLVTLSCETDDNTVTNPVYSMYMDFMTTNTVRIDDSTTAFGTFPRDQFFTVSGDAERQRAILMAHMHLFGTGTSGDLAYNLLNTAQRFSRNPFLDKLPVHGNLNVSDILVSQTPVP
jgi:hypothetical protein